MSRLKMANVIVIGINCHPLLMWFFPLPSLVVILRSYDAIQPNVGYSIRKNPTRMERSYKMTDGSYSMRSYVVPHFVVAVRAFSLPFFQEPFRYALSVEAVETPQESL